MLFLTASPALLFQVMTHDLEPSTVQTCGNGLSHLSIGSTRTGLTSACGGFDKQAVKTVAAEGNTTAPAAFAIVCHLGLSTGPVSRLHS